MGNWRTVQMTGAMSSSDAAKLREVLDHGDSWSNDLPDEAECLSFSTAHPGLCGLGAWPAERISRSGNLAERGYSVEDVRRALEVLLTIAPSMLLKVHCGGEYESDECVATVSVGEGLAVIGKPEVDRIIGPSSEQMMGNLLTNLMQRR